MAKCSSILTLVLNCSNSRPSDANATGLSKSGHDKSWQNQCSVNTAETFSAFLLIARRMTYLTRQFKQDYKKKSWPWRHCALDKGRQRGHCQWRQWNQGQSCPRGYEPRGCCRSSRFRSDRKILRFKLDPASEAATYADRRQVIKKNWLALCNMALRTALPVSTSKLLTISST